MWFRNIFSDNPSNVIMPGNNEGKVSGRGQKQIPTTGALTAQAVNLLNRMRLNTDQLSLNQPGGSRSSTIRKPAAEFREHRAYVPGDDVRYVDWKASARQEHVYIKQGEHEKAALVYIVIDTSASMTWGDPPKSSTALTLAHALGYLALAQGDRVTVFPVTDQTAKSSSLPILNPLWGKGLAPRLIQYLRSIRFGGKVDITQSIASLNKRNLSNGGLVLVISDLLSTSQITKGLAGLSTPAWKVTFIHLLHPLELNPGLNGHVQMVDIETGQKKLYTITPKALEVYTQRMSSWLNEVHNQCRESRAGYSLVSSGSSLENEILPQLKRDAVVKPL